MLKNAGHPQFQTCSATVQFIEMAGLLHTSRMFFHISQASPGQAGNVTAQDEMFPCLLPTSLNSQLMTSPLYLKMCVALCWTTVISQLSLGIMGRMHVCLLQDTFATRYIVGEKLGEGSFGSVFKGQRVSDGLQVAIEFVQKLHDDRYVESPVEFKVVPVEVALLQIMSQPPICKNVIQLLEWFDEPDRYILILERPDPCKSLDSVLQDYGGYVTEDMARDIMWQSVMAAFRCSKQGVLHRDIKPENLLINQDTLEVKLIDFGCGDLVEKYGYNSFEGTDEYCPPEFLLEERYHAGPATVWSLGVLMFRMVCRYLPFATDDDIIHGALHFRDGLSDGKINESILVNECGNDNDS
ncbi:hypothetical protein MHYP_G00028650 [Metynnis hypsauchen]